FLEELRRQFPCDRLTRPTGQVVIDVYEPLRKQPPYLTERHIEVLHQVLPLIQRANFRVQFVVWAATPAAGPWARAANQAHAAVEELALTGDLDLATRQRILPLGQPWRYRDIR